MLRSSFHNGHIEIHPAKTTIRKKVRQAGIVVWLSLSDVINLIQACAKEQEMY